MTVETLPNDVVVQLQSAPFTYPEVGATAGVLPPGYHHLTRARTLSARRDFREVVAELLSWQVQQRSGLRVASSSPVIEAGTVAVMRLGLGRAALTIPCRVVYVVDEPDRQGFAYGTLPGHPECGEQAFVVHRQRDGRTSFTSSSFSRPGGMLTRLAGPAARGAQLVMTHRYLAALDA